MIKRFLDLSSYKHSFFLFGPRQVGKTALIHDTFRPDIYIDLLQQKQFLKYSHDVSLLSDEINALSGDRILAVIDEIQKAPILLNEVHILLESKKKIQFILK